MSSLVSRAEMTKIRSLHAKKDGYVNQNILKAMAFRLCRSKMKIPHAIKGALKRTLTYQLRKSESRWFWTYILG